MRYRLATRAAWVLLGALMTMAPPAMTPLALADQATFRTGVVLLTIDVQVTPSKDAPLREMTLADFQVTVSGRSRPVATAAFLHLDEESVLSDQPRPDPAASSECIFRFHRKVDRRTAHYRLAIPQVESDRGPKEVKVEVADSTFAAQWLVWRLPVR